MNNYTLAAAPSTVRDGTIGGKNMAKLKPAGRKPKAPAPKQGLPCLILIVSGMILLLLMVYGVLKSS